MTTIPHIYDSIPGWFDWHDTYARWARETPPDGTIVEVGCFKGRSLAYLMVEIARAGRADLTVHAVDTWQGSPELQRFADVRDGSFLLDFIANMERLPDGVLRPVMVQADSVAAAAQFDDGSVDRIWLDGDHSDEGLTADLTAWWPKLKPGGEIGGHDYGAFEVAPAVHRFLRRHGLAMERLEPHADAVGSKSYSWLVRKPTPVTSWEVPPERRALLIGIAHNHFAVPTPTTISLARLCLGAREQAMAHGFNRVELYHESAGQNVETLRDRIAHEAILGGFSHLLFLDADMRWPSDVVGRLLQHHGAGIVSGLYFGRAYPHHPITLRRSSSPDPNHHSYVHRAHESFGLQRVDAIGMGVALIPVAVFGQMPRPWFRNQQNDEAYNAITEDVWFCRQARAANCPIWYDPALRCGHLTVGEVGARNYEAALPAIEAEYAANAAREHQRQAWLAGEAAS